MFKSANDVEGEVGLQTTTIDKFSIHIAVEWDQRVQLYALYNDEDVNAQGDAEEYPMYGGRRNMWTSKNNFIASCKTSYKL